MTTPNLYIVAGSDGFQRNRFFRSLVDEKKKEGWRVDRTDAKQSGSLDGVLASALFFDDPLLVVVENPAQGDLSEYQAHQESGNEEVWLVLLHEENLKKNTKFGKWASQQKKVLMEFRKPDKPWELEKRARKFIDDEFRRHGKEATGRQIQHLLDFSGVELGFLHFEIRKICILAGDGPVENKHVIWGIAQISGMDQGGIRSALTSRDPKKLVQHLHRYEMSSKDDTIKISRSLRKMVQGWLAAHKYRNDPDAAAAALGVNSWAFKKNMVPALKAWGEKDLRLLYSRLAQVERDIMHRGANSPWVLLSSRLVGSCLR